MTGPEPWAWVPKVADMTLGEAVEFLHGPLWGCACVGGEWCCGRRWEQATALVRAAHIAVKLVVESLPAAQPTCTGGVHGRFPVLAGWHDGCTVNGSEVGGETRFTNCRISPVVDPAEARRRFELGLDRSEVATCLRFGLPLPARFRMSAPE